MGSALEILCGQTYGAGKSHMFGVYLQRSWIILNCTALLFIPIHVFATPILKLLGQNDEVAKLIGKIAIWLLPQLFFYTFNFPMQKFLQAQRKVMVIAFTGGGVVILHTVLSWLIIFKLGWVLIGAAIVLDFSLWLIAICLFLYIVFKCPSSWKGFSWVAFKHLWSFVQLSCSSAVMLCLEFWYLQVLLFLAGHMSDAQIAVDSLSICLTINSLEFMIHIALQVAIRFVEHTFSLFNTEKTIQLATEISDSGIKPLSLVSQLAALIADILANDLSLADKRTMHNFLSHHQCKATTNIQFNEGDAAWKSPGIELRISQALQNVFGCPVDVDGQYLKKIKMRNTKNQICETSSCGCCRGLFRCMLFCLSWITCWRKCFCKKCQLKCRICADTSCICMPLVRCFRCVKSSLCCI